LCGREKSKVNKIKVGDRLLGEGEPTFIVAEIGVNHNGSIKMAKKLIDAAKDVGSDAVKFQVFKTERIVTKYAEKAGYQKETTDPQKSQYDMLKKLELKPEEVRELQAYAKKRSILFLSSAFDEESVDLLDSLDVPALKVASGEITNLPLLRHMAEKKRPIILSTGLSSLDEIKEALEVFEEKRIEDIVLLHCVTSYPAKAEEANLKVMDLLRRKFGFPVGFSDHTLGIAVPIAAVALGAVLIEKHLTLDKKLSGPDHRASLEPEEFRQMVIGIREVQKALGNGVKQLTLQEQEISEAARRSIVARIRIRKGTVIREDMLAFKRPGIGLKPKNLRRVIGKKAKKDIEADELITLEKLLW
jgi:N-acetylneuraminate synthase/N,N'-diacetyllegionaminate synthase